MVKLLVKIAIVLAVLVLIGGITLALVLPTLLSSDFARRKVSDYLSGNLHRPVTIEKVAFSWGEGLSINGAAVTEKDRTPLLKLSALRLAVSWRALMAGKVDISAFEINGADVILRRDQNGMLNVSDLFAAPATEVTARSGEKSPSNALPALFFKGSIRESNLTFVDERLKSTTRVQGLDADIVLPAIDEPLSVRATCDVVLNDAPPEPVTLSGMAELAPAGRLDPYRGKGSLELQAGFGDLKLFADFSRLEGDEPAQADAAELSCSIDLQKLTRLMAGVVGLPPGFSLKGMLAGTLKAGGSMKSRVTVDGTTELKNLSVAGGPLHKGSFSQPRMVFSHDISYYPLTGTVDIASFSLTGDFINLALSGTVTDIQKRPGGALRLTGSGSLAEIMLLARMLFSMPPDVSLSGDVNLSVSAEGGQQGVTVKGSAACRDLVLTAPFLDNRPFREKSLTIGHDIGLSIAKGGTIDAIDIASLALKGDAIDVALTGKVHDLQTKAGGTLRISGAGSLDEIVPLTQTYLSLPPDVTIGGNVNLSLVAEGDRTGLTVQGTTVFTHLDLNGDFLNQRPFRASSLKLEPDMRISIADRTEVAVHSLGIQSDAFDGTIQGTVDSKMTCNLKGRLSSRLAVLKKSLQGVLPASFPDDGQLVSDIELDGSLRKDMEIKGSHTVDGVRMVRVSSDGGPPASGPSTLILPGLTLAHDGHYAGDQDTLSLRMLQVDSSIGNVRWSGTLSRLSKDLFMNGKGEVSLNMADAADVAKGLLPVGLEARGKATLTMSCAGSLNPAGGSPFLASWNGEGALATGEINYAGFGSVRDLRSTKLSLNGGLVDAVFECAVNDGTARVEVRCDCNRDKPDVRMTAEVRGIRLSQDMKLLGYVVPILIIPPDGELSGKADVSAQAAWQGMDWQTEIGRTIEGKGTLTINDGIIRSRSVLSLVLKAFNKPERLPFETILTNFRLGEEKIFNDDITLKAKDLNLTLKGWTSLVSVPSRRGNPMEYSVKGDVIQKAVGGDAGKVLSVIGAGEMTLPVVIAGTVQDPAVSVKMPKAGDILRGLFGTDSQ